MWISFRFFFHFSHWNLTFDGWSLYENAGNELQVRNELFVPLTDVSFFFLRIKKFVYLEGNVDILRWFLCFFREVLLPHLRNFLYSKITLYQVRLSEITAMDKNNNYVGKITNITCYFPFVSFMIRLFLSAVGVTGSIMISRHVLHTILYTFPKVLTRGICLTVKRPFSW